MQMENMREKRYCVVGANNIQHSVMLHADHFFLNMAPFSHEIVIFALKLQNKAQQFSDGAKLKCSNFLFVFQINKTL